MAGAVAIRVLEIPDAEAGVLRIIERGGNPHDYRRSSGSRIASQALRRLEVKHLVHYEWDLGRWRIGPSEDNRPPPR